MVIRVSGVPDTGTQAPAIHDMATAACAVIQNLAVLAATMDIAATAVTVATVVIPDTDTDITRCL